MTNCFLSEEQKLVGYDSWKLQWRLGSGDMGTQREDMDR